MLKRLFINVRIERGAGIDRVAGESPADTTQMEYWTSEWLGQKY
jgi:hypothetical protein